MRGWGIPLGRGVVALVLMSGHELSSLLEGVVVGLTPVAQDSFPAGA